MFQEALAEELVLLASVVQFLTPTLTADCKLSKVNARREHARMLSEANSTYSYLCKLTSLGCAERLFLHVAMPHQRRVGYKDFSP